MSGFELRTSGIGSDRSTKWATSIAHQENVSLDVTFVNGTSTDYISFIYNNLRSKNFRLWQDSNFERQCRRQARWPLDHHHGPFFQLFCIPKISFDYLKPVAKRLPNVRLWHNSVFSYFECCGNHGWSLSISQSTHIFQWILLDLSNWKH